MTNLHTVDVLGCAPLEGGVALLIHKAQAGGGHSVLVNTCARRPVRTYHPVRVLEFVAELEERLDGIPLAIPDTVMLFCRVKQKNQ